MSEEKNNTNTSHDDSIKFNESIKEKLPPDFNVSDIGNIDLLEAEKIANEDILFLSEDDLILELEDIELEPVGGPREKPGQATTREKVVIKQDEHEDEETIVSGGPGVYESEISEPDDQIKQGVLKQESQDVVSVGKTDEHEEALEAVTVKDEISEEAATYEIHEEFSDKEEIQAESSFDVEDESDHELEDIHHKVAVIHDDSPHDNEHLDMNDYFQEQVEDMDVVEFDDIPVLQETEIEPVKEYSREEIPQHLATLTESQDNVFFADDKYVITGHVDDENIFEENELEKITSDIVEVIEGKAKVLYEAELETDKEMVAHGLTGIAPVFEDLLLDFEDEYKYTDDEIDFIHSVITEEDYADYIRYIDEYHGIKAKKGVTNAVELVGLTPDEVDNVEEKLFHEEYKDINLNEIFEYFDTDYTVTGKDRLITKNCTYIIPNENSLGNTERQSIESDLTAQTALIFEEDVDVIRDLYVKAVGAEKAEKVKVVDEIHDITDKVVIIEDEIDIDRFVMEYPEDKQDEIKKLLTYLDGLFEKLPRDTLKKFVDSEYFDLYVKVLTEMGV